MKGLKEFDPRQEPHDLVVLLALIGWITVLVYILNWCLDWVTTI
jgi:hypothetical protein